MNTKATHPVIPLTACSSSRIAAHGHCPVTNTLALRFHGKEGPGPIYHYAGFDAEAYKALTGAESIGKHFGQHIDVKDKDGKPRYPHTKIELEPAVQAGVAGSAPEAAGLKPAPSLASAP